MNPASHQSKALASSWLAGSASEEQRNKLRRYHAHSWVMGCGPLQESLPSMLWYCTSCQVAHHSQQGPGPQGQTV